MEKLVYGFIIQYQTDPSVYSTLVLLSLSRSQVAVPDLLDAAKSADILLFVIPHQFIGRVCDTMKGKINPDALGMSLIKGVDEGPDRLKLISEVIHEKLGIKMSVLMGANIANEVADEKFCETTIGCRDQAQGALLKELMQTHHFRVTVVQEADVVEICGALKNIVAVGAGFCDGLGFGDNTKAAVIRLSLMEMISFARSLLQLSWRAVVSLISLQHAMEDEIGKSRRPSPRLSLEELEKEMLNGQKLQGPATAAEDQTLKTHLNVLSSHRFPLFNAVYEICYEGRPVTEFTHCLQNHPEHQ
uniref:Glycerol-3-phosphate dehydrogenase [NAD(+)] n=1 Tax=Sinocyclocheilus anshuiensis TaxID=1608454 RepID=A0A671KN48_9TELE